MYLLSIGFLAVTSIAKVIVHVVLDSRNGYEIEYTSVSRFVYMLPYDNEVNEKDEKLKSICNILCRLSLLFLIFFLILFFLRKYIL